MKLYSAQISGNCYKIRLFLSLLGLEHEVIEVDWRRGETRAEWFRRLNPRGQVPVLQDGGFTVWDSQAILVYLARSYGENWLPLGADALASVMQWLAVSENELLYGLAPARAVKRYGLDYDFDQAQAMGRSGMSVMEHRLRDREWLATERPTVADVACFPYVSLAEEGEIPLSDFPYILRWIERVKALPGFTGM